MFNFVVLAHEEGVAKGPEAWTGPLLFSVIIFLSLIIAKRK